MASFSLVRESEQMGKCGERGSERERERELLYSSCIILVCVWDGPGDFSKEQINFPNCHRLFNESIPRLIHCSPGSIDRSLWSSTSLLCPFDFYCTWACLSLAIWYWWGKSGMLISLEEQCYNPPGYNTVASWWSKQAHATLFIKLNV